MKNTFTYILFLLFISQFSFSQENKIVKVESDNIIIDPIEKSAKFVSEKENVNEYLKSKLNFSTQNKIIKIRFEIDKNGRVINPKIINSLDKNEDTQIINGLSESENTQIINTFLNMPKWIPATQNGKPIRTEMILPLKF
jgi:hypothetical protein